MVACPEVHGGLHLEMFNVAQRYWQLAVGKAKARAEIGIDISAVGQRKL